MLITSSWLVDVFVIFISITFVIYKYSIRKHGYWKKRGVFYKEPLPFVGNMLEIFTFKTTLGEWLKSFYDFTKEPFFGIFVLDEPILILRSPELIKKVLVRNFNSFMDRTVLCPKHDKIVSNMIFFQKSPEWKGMRSKLTPAFTVGKLKGMFSIINNIGLEMNQYIRKNLGQQEFKEICAKFSTDVIAKCAFGINSHCFEYEDANFREVGRSIFDFSWRNGIVHSSYFFMHGLAKLLRLNFFEKRAVTYLSDAFWSVIKEREKINIKGNDLIDILVEVGKNKNLFNESQFGEKVVAQAIQFFAAGFETTSTTIAFTLYELCVQPQLQDKLRCEIINNIKENNGITYEALQNMKILEMCIMETLRKYPAVPFLDRRCNEDYKIDGTDIVIEKGMSVFIPTLALHYDPQYFPEPDKYKPERFSDKNNYNVDGLYYLPFGEGPRICIGERFGMLVTKLGLVHILSEFEVERIPDTPVPMEFEPKSLLLQSKVGLPMRVKEYQPISE